MFPIIALVAAATAAPIPVGLAAYVHDQRLTRYNYALTDLNGDGHSEALVYAWRGREDGQDISLCGSGGCDLIVLSLTPTGYHIISDISLTRLPIRVLSGVSHGWHDLSVLVAGGGILPGYRVQLRFDGKTYPPNPTVLSAQSMKTAKQGTTVIDANTK